VLNLGPQTRVFIAVDPVDLRGSFDALAGHVRRLHGDPLNGHVYLFVSRRRRLLKALWFDRTGLTRRAVQ
jgi:transposase